MAVPSVNDPPVTAPDAVTVVAPPRAPLVSVAVPSVNDPPVIVPDAVTFLSVAISLLLSTTSALPEATVPAVTPSSTFSSDAATVVVPSSNDKIPLA